MKLCECGCGQETPIATHTRSHLGYVKGEPVRFVRGHNRKSFQNSPEHRAKQSEALQCDKHFNWKGDEVGYIALHQWLYANKERTGICDECGGEGKTEFANISGEYRRDVEDFAELCISCHRKLDNAVENLYALS